MDAPVGSELTPVGQLPDRVVGDGWTLLYCLGSYAPAHRNHMELLVLARQFCEQRGLRVLGIMVAPTADSSLREKLGFLPLPLEARYHCLRLLFASTPGLAGIPVLVDRYLAEGRVKGAGAAAQHIEELIKEKYGGQVFVRPVFGLDALTRIRSRHAVANAIVVLNRSSSEVGPDPDAFVARHPHGAAIKYIASPNWREGTMSSTKIRAKFARGEDISAETHPDFVKYLHDHGVRMAPAVSAAPAVPVPDLVTSLYVPKDATGAALPLANGWYAGLEIVPFSALSPAEGLLGQGRQAQTAKMRLGEAMVAVKRAATVRQGDNKIIAREMYFLTRLRPHPHVVQLIGAGITPEGFMFMILELALCSASAELAAHPVFMVHEPRAPLSRGWLRVLHGVALGMAHVHACGILHRDLSTDNVLLTAPPADAACRALVADFGVAKEGRDAATIARGACRKYAPEALGTKGSGPFKQDAPPDYIYVPASDVFMFATLAYEVLCGRVYFSERTTAGACTGTLEGERPVLPHSADLNALIDLIQDCWADAVADRPTFVQVAARLQALLTAL